MDSSSQLVNKEELAWLVLARLPHIGGRRGTALVTRFGTAQAALEASTSAWGEVIGNTCASKARGENLGWDKALEEWQRLAALGGEVVTWEKASYPSLLREITDYPLLLCGVGPATLDGPLVGIVGGRKAGTAGLQTAYKLAVGLAERGIGVVSGLALGVDTAAHQGALAVGGRTIAVLGCGADYIYPSANRGLYRRIVQTGAIISEYPMGAAPEPGWFPRRNRLISGLSMGIILVEANQRSGALITASYALEQNREVFAVPGEVLYGRSTGCHRLIQDGAKLVEGIDDVLEELEPQLRVQLDQTANLSDQVPTDLKADEQALVTYLADATKHVDELAQQSGLPTGEILGTLLQLELAGVVEQLPGKRFVRSKG